MVAGEPPAQGRIATPPIAAGEGGVVKRNVSAVRRNGVSGDAAASRPVAVGRDAASARPDSTSLCSTPTSDTRVANTTRPVGRKPSHRPQIHRCCRPLGAARSGQTRREAGTQSLESRVLRDRPVAGARTGTTHTSGDTPMRRILLLSLALPFTLLTTRAAAQTCTMTPVRCWRALSGIARKRGPAAVTLGLSLSQPPPKRPSTRSPTA